MYSLRIRLAWRAPDIMNSKTWNVANKNAKAPRMTNHMDESFILLRNWSTSNSAGSDSPKALTMSPKIIVNMGVSAPWHTEHMMAMTMRILSVRSANWNSERNFTGGSSESPSLFRFSLTSAFSFFPAFRSLVLTLVMTVWKKPCSRSSASNSSTDIVCWFFGLSSIGMSSSSIIPSSSWIFCGVALLPELSVLGAGIGSGRLGVLAISAST
mmetsp:Transcript_13835/g.23612  ORF Transcript_13835/g.23612 Transcript_13835/m.23612 type:complete len:212 (-) Transcript_13835:1456-2091(-)